MIQALLTDCQGAVFTCLAHLYYRVFKASSWEGHHWPALRGTSHLTLPEGPVSVLSFFHLASASRACAQGCGWWGPRATLAGLKAYAAVDVYRLCLCLQRDCLPLSIFPPLDEMVWTKVLEALWLVQVSSGLSGVHTQC